MKKFKNIYFEITKVCNLSCPFCPCNKSDNKVDEYNNNFLPYDTFVNYFNQVSNSCEGIYLHILGEPLLHHDLFKMIAYASRFVKVNITTNGRLIQKYLNEIVDANISILNISLQSLINEDKTYIDDYFMTIDRLLKLKKKSLAVHIRLWNDENKEEVASLNKYLLLKLQQYNFIQYQNVNIMKSTEFMWPNLDNKVNYVKSKCLGGINQLGVLMNGDVVLCCLDYNGATKLGNLNEEKFMDILNSEKYCQAILNFKNRKTYFELCRHCTFRNRFK